MAFRFSKASLAIPIKQPSGNDDEYGMLPAPFVALPTSSVLFGEIALAAVLLTLVILKPGIVRTLEGKVLILLALFLAPAIAAYGGVNASSTCV